MHRALVAAALVVLISGCGSEAADAGSEPDPGYEGEASAVLLEGTKLLDEASSAALTSMSGKAPTVSLTFSRHSAQLDELEAGDVLIVGGTPATPHGALLAVDDVSDADDGVVVTAHRAALKDAFEELHVHLTSSFTPEEAPLAMPLGVQAEQLGTVQQALGDTFPIRLSAGDAENGIELDGSLSLERKIDFALDIDFAKLELDELSLSFTASETFIANLTGHGQAGFEERQHLATLAGKTLTLLVPIPGLGTVPILITSQLELEAGIKGSIEGDASIGVTQRAGFTAGLGYKDGAFQAFSDDDSDFDTDDPSFSGSASIRAWAGPKLEVLVYGFLGPYAGVEGFIEASASVEGDPPCITGALDAGLSGTAGVEFIADYSTILFEERYRLAGFDSCDPDLDGPDAATTWARTYGREGSDAERAQSVIQVSDGGYLVLGETNLFAGVRGFAAATWVLRLDALGNVLWQRAFQRVEQGLARAALEVSGGFVVAGDAGILRLDSGGNLLWARHYQSENGVEITSLAPRDDGSVLVAGLLPLAGRALVMLLDAQGDVAWARACAGSDFKRVRTTSDGGALLVGSHAASDGNFYLVRLDADGGVLWQRSIDNAYDAVEGVEDAQPDIRSSLDSGYDAVEKPDGSLVLVGESYGNFPIPEAAPGGYFASAVVELDAGGGLVASNVYRAPSDALYGSAYAAMVRPNGSSLVVARGASEAPDLLSSEDVLLIQDGAFSVLDGGGNDYVFSSIGAGIGRGMPVQLTSDGGAILAVTSNSFRNQEEVWLLKLSRTGSIASPYRSNLSGTSYVNEHATSFELDAPVEDEEVTSRPFATEVGSEVTPVVSSLQSR